MQVLVYRRKSTTFFHASVVVKIGYKWRLAF